MPLKCNFARSSGIFFLTIFLASTLSSPAFASEPVDADGKRESPVQREQWFLRGRTYRGKVAPQMLERAQQQRDVLRRKALFHAQMRSALTTNGTGTSSSLAVWTPLGPSPLKSVTTIGDDGDYGLVTGRATTVVVDQNDPTGNTVYLGGAYGGVWKSTTAANTDITKVFWQPIIDDQATIAVGAIAIQPKNSNLLLVGTGEPNSSTDSYYGLGILRSTDGGSSWQLITSANGGLRPFHGLAFSKIAFSTDNPNIVVAATAAASGGITVGAEIPPNSAASCNVAGATATCRGLYYSYDSGLTWNQATMVDPGNTTPDNGSSSSVIYNPQQHKFYAASRAHGIYVSADGITFTRMGADPFGFSQPASALNTTNCPTSPTNLATCPLYRAEIAQVPGRDEMYVWYVDSSKVPLNGGIYQTKDGGKTWVALSVSGINSCGDTQGCGTAQGDYNLTLAALPNGATATDVYAGAINLFRCQINSNNPTCAANPFVNLTHVYGCSPSGSFSKVHPDQHWIDFLQSNPNIVYFANDGGLYRTLSALSASNVPASCPTTPPAAPFYPFDNLNGTMGSMTQFVWFSQHPSDQYTFLGGTQDNGSPAIDPNDSGPNGLTWRAVQGGDGGYNAINPNNANEWFASYNNVQITRCPNGPSCTDSQFLTVVKSSTVGGDSSAFYMPYMLDPQDSTKLIVGTCRVWRMSTSGLNAVALSQNFATGATGACASDSATFISALAAGGAVTSSGSQVIYAGTDNGKVFANKSALSSTTTWTEVSANSGFNSKGYPISGIGLDPRDTTGKTAYVTVMGFGISHVWRTTDAGTTWSDITGNIPDSPANGVVVDGNSGTIYVATDVGVFSTDAPNGTATSWTEVGPATGTGALPNVAVTRIAIFAPPNQPARLRASTYGRGVWEMPLSSNGVPDYTISISNPTLLTYPGNSVTFNGTLTSLNSYASPVTVSCDASSSSGSGPLPQTCSSSPVAPVPTASGTAFTVSASNPSIGDFYFRVQGVGSDSNVLVRQAAVTLRVIDFTLGTPTPSSVNNLPHGNSTIVQISVTSLGSFDQQVTVSCDTFDLPTNWTCSTSTLTLTPGATATTTLTIKTDANTAPGTYNLTLIGVWKIGSNPIRVQTQPLPISVVSAPGFLLNSPAFSQSTVKVQQPLTSTISITQRDGYNGTVTLSCTGATSSGIAPSDCSFNPAIVTVGATAVTSTLTVNTASGIAGSGQVTIQATDGALTSTAVLPFTLADYALSNVSQPNDTQAGGTVNFSFSLVPSASYSGTIALGCDTSAFNTPVSCTFTPASPTLVSGTTTKVNASIVIPSNVANGTYTVTLQTSDASLPSLAHNQALASFNVAALPDFNMSFVATNNATIKAGASATGTLALTATGSFNSAVNFTVAGCPSLATCAVSPNPANPTSTTPVNASLTITTTAPTVAVTRPTGVQRNYLALWLGLSFGTLGLVILRKPRTNLSLLIVACAVLIGMAGCGGGGGGNSGGTTPLPKPGTPAGTYTVVVTGTAGTTVKTANFTLTVQ